MYVCFCSNLYALLPFSFGHETEYFLNLIQFIIRHFKITAKIDKRFVVLCILEFSDKIDAGLRCQKPQGFNENGLCLY